MLSFDSDFAVPRIVGRGGSGLDRLRSTGVDVEVVGKRDANRTSACSLVSPCRFD